MGDNGIIFSGDKMIELLNLKIPVDYTEQEICMLISKKLRVDKIEGFRFLKKSVDARKKDNVFYSASVGVTVNNEQKVLKNAKNKDARLYKKPERITVPRVESEEPAPIVCGAGPAGLFCALFLAKAGLRPVLIERGADADTRKKDIEDFFKTGKLNIQSNVQFGEGGAGTFSDGKLTTNIRDPRCNEVLEVFYECGAPEEILYLNKPHLGTDNLITIVKNLRKQIISLGGEVRFLTRLTDIEYENDALKAVTVEKNGEKERIETSRLIIAAGHSARDIFEMLKKHSVKMEKKPFSIGVRVEHKQEMINKSQYGSFSKYLPAADYKLAVHLENGRSVYTFCMCPGGQVVNASSEEGHLVVNGMSLFARDGENANSALLVNVEPEDFAGDDILSGIDFQQKYEKQAFILGGSSYKAPAQRVGDFLRGVPSKEQNGIMPTCPTGVTWCDLKGCLPDFAIESLKKAIPLFDNKIKGFSDENAVLTGVETRSSSPVRILRDELFESSIKGIYPCGEGAGYAGGIMSAAVDGIRIAQKILETAAHK